MSKRYFLIIGTKVILFRGCLFYYAIDVTSFGSTQFSNLNTRDM